MASPDSQEWGLRIANESEIDRVGEILARWLPNGCVVELRGPLGAGKTRLVQAIAKALAMAPGLVSSPTFSLVNEYEGARRIAHLDAYRLSGAREFAELGPEEIFAGADLSFVEWGEKVASELPATRIMIQLNIAGPNARDFQIAATGQTYAVVVQQIREKLAE